MTKVSFTPEILTKNSVLTFGKHKGKTIKQILELEDATYLRWCLESTIFKVGRSLRSEILSQAEAEDYDHAEQCPIDPYDFCD